MARALGTIGDAWSLMIVRDIMSGRSRFSEIQRSLGLARNTLTTRLRGLIEAGVLEQSPAAEESAYYRYALTEKGADLYVTLAALREWGERWQFPVDAPQASIVDSRDGRSVSRLELRASDGRVLGRTIYGS